MPKGIPKVPPSFRVKRLPTNAHPLIVRVFEEINRQQKEVKVVAHESGVGYNTILHWRHRNVPTVVNLDAVLNVLGKKLTITDLGE